MTVHAIAAAPTTARTDARAAAAAPQATTPPATASPLIYDHRDTARSIWRWGVGLALPAAILGVAALAGRGGGSSVLGAATTPWALGGALVTAAVGQGMALLQKPKSLDVLADGIPTLDAAQAQAAGLHADTGLIKAGDGTYSITAFPGQENFDNVNLSGMRIGDGSITFDRLVTRDGDVLVPSGGEGYRDTGAALPAVDLRTITPTDTAALNALTGLQIATDHGHNVVTLGPLTGNTAGYGSALDASKAMYEANKTSEHAVLQVGDRYFAFDLAGPPIAAARARGTRIEPLSSVTIQSDKFGWKASQPRSAFDFAGRMVPFTTDEPIGFEAHIPSNWSYGTGVIRRHEGTYASRDTAIYTAVSQGAIDAMLNYRSPFGWNFAPDEYFVIKGDTPHGSYNVYAADDGWGSGAKDWKDQYGKVEAAVYRDVDTRTTDRMDWDNDTDRETVYKRVNVDLADARLGYARTVATSGWEFDHYNYFYDDNTPDYGGSHNPPIGNGGSGSGNPPIGDGGSGSGSSNNPPIGSGGSHSGSSDNPPIGDNTPDYGDSNPPIGG